MGRVLTNNTGLSYAIESALGLQPTAGWKLLEPNTINTYGATVTTVSRNPISNLRQRRKGTVTDLESAVEFEADLTVDSFNDFIEGFCFATGVNADMHIAVTDVQTTTDVYIVAALSASQADKLEFVAASYASLVFGRGFTNSGNNGLKEVDADIASSATEISVVENLTDEAAPPGNARVELAGLRSLAAAADFTWDYDAGTETAQLISAADITDFSQFGLTPGQFVHIGSGPSGAVINAFENSVANDMFGYARIRSIDATAGTITFDKLDAALKFDDAVAPTTAVDILFGDFIRNVAVDAADFIERSFHFEAAFINLENPGPGDEYEYAAGNFCNSLAFQLPLTDKATLVPGFIGTDAQQASTTRATGAATPLLPLGTAAFNTSSDILRLRITQIDETGLTTDFKNVTLTLNNNVSPEKVLGLLGAKFLNTGNFEVNLEAQLLFTNSDVTGAIRANTTVTMDWRIKNDDGAVYFDIPSMILGGGDREFPVDESVLINLTGEAFNDDTLGTSIGVSTFPTVP
jgi:hypothetical protein